MTISVKNKPTSPSPGRYFDPVTIEWDFGVDVRKVVFSLNDIEPVISEYIAYDTLTPPTPFIAVTQDGAGNVCYDGGFPKFYNGSFVGSPTSFSELTATYKYLYNALMFIANTAKFNAGNRKVLIIGDANSGASYNVKDQAGNSFNASLTKMSKVNINDVEGDNWIFTYKTPVDYASGLLDPNLNELNEYVACIMFSTVMATVPLITDSGANDLASFRRQGGGLMFITDHGQVISDIETAKNGTYSAFFRTANKVTVKFGAWFTGDYNRSPVNVGHLRNTYGDHALYNGMTDSESIFAGGSESKVIVNESIDLKDPQDIGPTLISQPGVNNLNFLLLGNGGEIVTVRYVYVIGALELIYFKDRLDNKLTDSVDIGFRNSITLDLGIHSELVSATITGKLYKNDLLIGEFKDDIESGTVVDWYAGTGIPIFVNNQDKFRAVVDFPFSTQETLTIDRLQPDLTNDKSLAVIVSKLKPIVPTAAPQDTVRLVIDRIDDEHVPMTYTKLNSINVKLIKSFMQGEYLLPKAQAYIYKTAEDLEAALTSLTPPTPKEIFDNWNRIRNNEYYPKGQGIPVGNEAAAWTWNDALQSAVMPLNSVGFMGFVSENIVDYYDHEVTLKSDGADNDGNGVILAFDRDAGINHMFVALVSPGYDIANSPNINLIYRAGGAGGSLGKVLASNSNDDIRVNWSGRYKRVSVQRRGDVFNLKFSLWSTLTYAEELNMTINLNDHPELARFKGPKNYGYYNHSQAGSYFQDIEFYSGVLNSIIVDALNNQVYKYRTEIGWELLEGVAAHNIFGSPRILESSDGEEILLNQDGTITFL